MDENASWSDYGDNIRDLRKPRDYVSAGGDAPALNGGGGDGTSGGMDARVARLEADMDHVKRSLSSVDGTLSVVQKDLTDVRVSVARVEVDLKHLPSKGFIFSVCAGLLSAVGVLTAVIVRFVPHAG